ncbi:MAG: N-acetylmuramoyl-L-alanine amidase [Balneolaceae bacterium]
MVSQVFAQPSLERISAIERSDGKGFVVRHHLTEMVDSFKVVHSSPDFLQVSLYSQGLDTADYRAPEPTDVFREISINPFSGGLGIDIFMGAGHYFNTRAYPDQNQKDILLALERASYSEIEANTDNVNPVVWENFDSDDYSFTEEEDNRFLNLRDNNNFNVIVLDAGHGGHDPGSMNRSLGLIEKDIALAVTKKVGEYIEQNMPGVEVVYTRKGDEFITLEERGLKAARSNADLFVSIHANSVSTSNASGSEVFFLGLERSESALEIMKQENSVVALENGGEVPKLSEEELLIYELAHAGNIAVSERIAVMVENQFRTRAQRRSRGVKQARFVVLWHASTPAVLVELGFLSNPNEARYLTDDYGQSVLASAIFRAIRDFKLEYDKSLRNGSEEQASND